MKKNIIFLFFFFIISNCNAQITDNVIVKALLGRSSFDTNPILDSLGVWYKIHLLEAKSYEDKRAKVYSISNSNGSVKVFFIKADKNKIINEIIINFRHDSREQVEDEKNVTGAADYHVGSYSTDIVFKLKN